MSFCGFSASQAALAAAFVASSVGSFAAITPPNPNPTEAPGSGSAQFDDLLHKIKFTHGNMPKVAMAPIGLLALHSSALSLTYPNTPASLLRHGVENGLNTDLITWSTATAVPLALILCVGVPLRLIPYASLGKNFTYAITEPDHLTTTGIYRYVQHPSYTGVAALLAGNASLLYRLDGVLSCWISPRWYQSVRSAGWTAAAVIMALLGSVLWARVRQEERVLRSKFGAEWETWHAKTARFIPFLI